MRNTFFFNVSFRKGTSSLVYLFLELIRIFSLQDIIDKFENRDLSFQPLIIFVKNSILNTPLKITSENVLVEFILEQNNNHESDNEEKRCFRCFRCLFPFLSVTLILNLQKTFFERNLVWAVYKPLSVSSLDYIINSSMTKVPII